MLCFKILVQGMQKQQVVWYATLWYRLCRFNYRSVLYQGFVVVFAVFRWDAAYWTQVGLHLVRERPGAHSLSRRNPDPRRRAPRRHDRSARRA
jgi:hypothetical protein